MSGKRAKEKRRFKKMVQSFEEFLGDDLIREAIHQVDFEEEALQKWLYAGVTLHVRQPELEPEDFLPEKIEETLLFISAAESAIDKLELKFNEEGFLK